MYGEQTWDKILMYIKENENETTYKTWFSNIKFLNFVDNVFVLQVTSEFNKNILTTQHSSKLSDAIKDVAGDDCEYFIVLENENINYMNVINHKSNKDDKGIQEYKPKNLNPKYTFSEFVIGSNNRFAHAAALSVAENPGNNYNPLFIYGQVGIGKTHLIQAIAQKVLEDNPKSVINYVTSETFTNELIEAIHSNKRPEFRNKYRKCDVLIVDDVQFIGGKESTEEEFYNTFNAMHESNKQIIMAADRPPSEIKKLEERLKSRFSSGLICDIQIPNYETKIAILKKKSKSMHIDINDEVCAYIANNIKTNIRELEGALTRINALSKLTNMPITLEMATEALKDIFTLNSPKEIDSKLIKEIVCRYYNVSIKDIISKKRSQKIAFPRQVAMYIIRELTELPFSEIGEHFGGRDHSTVISAYNKIESEIQKKEDFKKVINNLVLEIKGEN